MKKSVDVLVEGGKASAGPPLGPALGALGVNIGEVVKVINERTKDFDGMKVPVKVIVNAKTKKFEIEVGTPPVSALIKKELGLEKASQNPGTEIVGDLSLEQAKKIARMKIHNMLSYDENKALKEVLGTCVSMGITVDSQNPKEIQKKI